MVKHVWLPLFKVDEGSRLGGGAVTKVLRKSTHNVFFVTFTTFMNNISYGKNIDFLPFFYDSIFCHFETIICISSFHGISKKYFEACPSLYRQFLMFRSTLQPLIYQTHTNHSSFTSNTFCSTEKKRKKTYCYIYKYPMNRLYKWFTSKDPSASQPWSGCP